MDNPNITFDPTHSYRIDEFNKQQQALEAETPPALPLDTPEPNPEQDTADAIKLSEENSESTGQSLVDTALGAGRNILEGSFSVPISLLDFGIDAAATVTSPVPGVGPTVQNFNTSWDDMTRFKNPLIQKIREMASVVVPTLLPVGKATAAIRGLQASKAVKAGLGLGAAAGIDAAVIGLSDQGNEDNTVRVLSDTFPSVFGSGGAFPVPESWKTMDGESPAVRKQKNMLDSAAFSVVGDVLGFVASGAKPALRWFIPKDETAKAYKEATQLQSNVETYKRITEIDQALATGPSTANARILKEERAKLVKQVNEGPITDANSVGPYQKAMEDANASRADQIDEEALLQLELGLDEYSPQITPGLALPGANASQAIPPANIAHNRATTAAIKKGIAEGDPVPLGGNGFFKKFAVLGRYRDAITSLAKQGVKSGKYDAVVDGVRISSDEMDEASWEIYTDIMRPGMDPKEIRAKFLPDMDVKTLPSGEKVYTFSGAQTLAAKKAIADLSDLYLGREVTESSARLMDTFGREIASYTEGARNFRELVDDERLHELVGTKLEFLLSEEGLSDYIAGFTLRQRRNWYSSFFKAENAEELANVINKEFSDIYQEAAEKAKAFRNQLDIAAEQSPQLVKALYDTYSYTNGDVDTINKLTKYFNAQFDLGGFLFTKPTKGKMNELYRGFFNVRYNNILSGLSAAKAFVGSSTLLITKPTTALLAHGAEAIFKRDLEPLKRGLYFYSGFAQTNQRALGDAWRRIRYVNSDPDSFIQGIRKDHQIIEDGKWAALDQTAKAFEETGKFGNLVLYRAARGMHDMAKMSVFRYGTTLMSGIDAYTDTFMGTLSARVKAYDDVFTKYGEVTPELLQQAEAQHYAKLFDSKGILKDKYAKYGSGEIAMNLDSSTADVINRITDAIPALKTFIMFPRTAVNYAKVAMSYTPIAYIPGVSKQAKTLYAGNDINKIKDALLEHGLDFDTEPNAMAIYQNLRSEYLGRLMFGNMVVGGAFALAASGRLRGNGPVSAADRRKLRDNYNWREKTVKIGDKWVSYAGFPMVEYILSTVGDVSYYAQDIGSSMSQTIQDKLAWTISATFLNNTPLQGLEPLMALTTGDDAAATRFLAREVRSLIPASGGLSVLARAIDGAQKDIYNDLVGYVTQNVPVARNGIPNRIDYWTGKPINDFDNPILRALNAVNPVQVTDDGEDWRQWLVNSGWTGFDFIKTSSKGVPYTAEQREAIGELIGQQQIWKQVKAIMNNKSYNDEIAEFKALARSGASFPDLEVKASKMRVYEELNAIVRTARDNAEQFLMDQGENPELRHTNLAQDRIDKLVESGQPTQAAQEAQKYQEEIDNLRKYNSLTP